MDLVKANTLGTVIAFAALFLCILIFAFRLAGASKVEFWLGILFMLVAIPLLVLLVSAGSLRRPPLFFIQIGVMLAFIFVELLLDYILKVDFRHIRWMTVTYVTLFFAATGGMVGLASLSGKLYTIIAVILFFTMTFLAIYQRIKTGM